MLIEKVLHPEYEERNENANRFTGAYGWIKCMVAEEQMKEYALTKLYPKHVSEAHKKGYIYIHDLSNPIIPYCCGHDIMKILTMGFKSPAQFVSSRPPKHLSSFLMQIVNYFGVMASEWAGAQAINNLDLFASPFIRYDRLSYKKLKQIIQEFIYNLNISYRWGLETVFSNVTLAVTVPEEYENMGVIIGGEVKDKTYGDFEEEIQMFNKAFFEVLAEGDVSGRPFSFPIPTVNVTEDFPWDSDFGKLFSKVTAKYGLPYFQNCIGTDIRPGENRAMCCRLMLSIKELKKIKRYGGIFGYNDNVGSIGVVTLNLPLIAYEARKDEDKFFELLDHYLNIAREALMIKRQIISENLVKGMMPYTRIYLYDWASDEKLKELLKEGRLFETFFNTIGVVGGHEMCLNLLGVGIETNEGLKFTCKVLDFIRDRIDEWIELTGVLWNLEETPAESAAGKLAKISKKRHPDIITSGTKENPYFTNSTHLPVGLDIPLFEALRHQEKLKKRYTGGSMFHIYLGETPPADVVPNLVMKICRKTQIPYFSITTTYSICENHGYLSGVHWTCPYCGKECQVYSRVTGYYRAVQVWNDAKKQEFKERKFFKI